MRWSCHGPRPRPLGLVLALFLVLRICNTWSLLAPVAAEMTTEGFGVHPISVQVGCAPGRPMVWWPWTQNVSFGIEDLGAQFLVIHVAFMRLPPGAVLEIRGHPGDRPHRQAPPRYRFDSDTAESNFFVRPIHARHAVLEYTIDAFVALDSAHAASEECYGFYIDQYRSAAKGIVRYGSHHRQPTSNANSNYLHPTRQVEIPLSAFPGNDDTQYTGTRSDRPECVSNDDESEEAACLRFNAEVFEKSSAIVRLLVHKPMGSVFCTGWMFGCQGHIITNHHCVGDEQVANSTVIEFLAQGRKCRDNCDEPMGCPGVIEATSSEVVAFSPTEALDYTLLLPRLSPFQLLNLTRVYGFLTMRSAPAEQGERIFIPQHPAGFGKRIALKQRAAYGQVESVNEVGCNRHLASVGYLLDTRGGSSGAPVIATSDHAVVGLHYCGGCLNSAIPSHHIIQSLIDSSTLPKCAQAEFAWPGPTALDISPSGNGCDSVGQDIAIDLLGATHVTDISNAQLP